MYRKEQTSKGKNSLEHLEFPSPVTHPIHRLSPIDRGKKQPCQAAVTVVPLHFSSPDKNSYRSYREETDSLSLDIDIALLEEKHEASVSHEIERD